MIEIKGYTNSTILDNSNTVINRYPPFAPQSPDISPMKYPNRYLEKSPAPRLIMPHQ